MVLGPRPRRCCRGTPRRPRGASGRRRYLGPRGERVGVVHAGRADGDDVVAAGAAVEEAGSLLDEGDEARGLAVLADVDGRRRRGRIDAAEDDGVVRRIPVDERPPLRVRLTSTNVPPGAVAATSYVGLAVRRRVESPTRFAPPRGGGRDRNDDALPVSGERCGGSDEVAACRDDAGPSRRRRPQWRWCR